MCDSMGDFFLDAYFDEEVELRGIYRPCHKSCYRKLNYDPQHYSRLAAVCQRCGARYDNLQRSVAKTAEEARRNGWQIERCGNGYEWYCPKCRTAHDFENVETSKFGVKEVESIKQAVWVFESGQPDNAWAWWYKCSECGFSDEEHNQKMYPFCPNCGTKMKGDNNENHTDNS